MMETEQFAALLAFAFVTSVTPGPNNLMLIASGANFGLRASLPHMLGISLGHGLMTVLVGLGLGAALQALPGATLALKGAATIYMLWLAWKIAHAAAPGQGELRGARPMTFLQAAAFQWVNPKAWAMSMGAMAAYAAGGGPGQVALVAAVFVAVNLPCITLWAWAGDRLRHLLHHPTRRRIFNVTMAALLLASLAPVLAL